MLLTLVRELAVQMLYETQCRSLVTRDVLQREAKAIVFVIGNAPGLETESAENIQLYRGNLSLLAESLEVVQRISAVILGALSPEDVQTEKAVPREVRSQPIFLLPFGIQPMLM
jgi:hypothetical protein